MSGPENGISAARCDRAIDTHVRRRRRAQESSRVCAILLVPNFRRLKFENYVLFYLRSGYKHFFTADARSGKLNSRKEKRKRDKI